MGPSLRSLDPLTGGRQDYLARAELPGFLFDEALNECGAIFADGRPLRDRGTFTDVWEAVYPVPQSVALKGNPIEEVADGNKLGHTFPTFRMIDG